MKEKARGFLGFLGLVDDDHGDFAPNYGREVIENDMEESWSVGNDRPLSPLTRPAPRAPQPAQPQRPAAQPRTIPSVTVLGGTNGSAPRAMEPMSTVRRGAPTAFNPSRDLQVFAPKRWNDVNQIVLILRENRAVVLSTAGLPKEAQRRIKDFTSGAAYALRSTLVQLNEVRWLVVPQGLIIEKEFIEQLKHANLADGQL